MWHNAKPWIAALAALALALLTMRLGLRGRKPKTLASSVDHHIIPDLSTFKNLQSIYHPEIPDVLAGTRKQVQDK